MGLTGPVTTATAHGTTGTNLGTTQMTGVHDTTTTVPATTGMGPMISAVTDMGPRVENPVVRTGIPARMILADISVARTEIVRTDQIDQTGHTGPIVMGHEAIPAGMTRNHGTVRTASLAMGIVLTRVMIAILPSVRVIATDLRAGHTKTARAGNPMATGNHVTVPMGTTKSRVMTPTVQTARVDGPAMVTAQGTKIAQGASPMVIVLGTVTVQAGNPTVTAIRNPMVTEAANPMAIVEEDHSTAMIGEASPRTVMTEAASPRTEMTAEENPRTVMTGEGNRRTEIVVTGAEGRTGNARTDPRTVRIVVGSQLTVTVAGNSLMGIAEANPIIAMTVAGRITPTANSGRTVRVEGTISRTQTGIRLNAIRAGTVKSPRTVLASGLMDPVTGIGRGPIRKTTLVHVMTPSADRGSSRGNATAAKNLSRPGPGWRHARMSRLCPSSMTM